MERRIERPALFTRISTAAVLGEHLLDHFVDLLELGEIALVGHRAPAGVLDLLLRLGQPLRVAIYHEHGCAGCGDLQRRGLADALAAAGDHHDLALDGAGEAAIDEQLRVEMPLPVVPQFPGVAFDRRDLDSRAGQGALGLAVVEAGRVVDELQDARRQSEILHDLLADAAHRLHLRDAPPHALGDEGEHAGVHAQRHLRRMSGVREDIEQVANPAGVGVGEMEAAPVQPRLVRDVVHRCGDEVHRHQVQTPAFQPDGRHPRRQQPAQLLERLEEVVGSVDLVHLAGARIADHDARAVDAPGPLAFLAHDALGFVLGAEIGVFEVLGLLEHVLAEHTLVQSCGGDRADQMHAAGLDCVGELDGVARALHIGELLGLSAGLEVVDRSEVEEVVDPPAQPFPVGLGNSEVRLGQIADHRDGALGAHAPACAQRVDRGQLVAAHQEVQHGALALQEALREARSDETGSAGDEVTHGTRSSRGRPRRLRWRQNQVLSGLLWTSTLLPGAQ